VIVEFIHCVATNFNRQGERVWCLSLSHTHTHTTPEQMNLKICAVEFEKRMDTIRTCLLRALLVSRSENVATNMLRVCKLFSKHARWLLWQLNCVIASQDACRWLTDFVRSARVCRCV